MSFKLKECAAEDCNNEFKQYNSLQKYCSYKCKTNNIKRRVKTYSPPNKKSKKRIAEDAVYSVLRKDFLKENPRCAVFPSLKSTEIHHMRKRRGFADEHARLNNTPLYLDTRFFLAVSRIGHLKIENNPEWAYKMGYSIKNNIK